MSRVLFGLGAIALICAALIFAFDPAYQQQRQEQARYQAEQHALTLKQQQWTLTQQQQQVDATATSQAILDNVIWLAASAAICLALFIAYDSYQRRREPLVHPDARGLLPVARHAITEGQIRDLVAEAVLLYHHTRALDAQHQPGQSPAQLTYTPHFPTPMRSDDDRAAETMLGGDILTFGQLLDAGRVGPGNPLLLGYDLASGTPLHGSWLDLYSTAVSGMPGSGKTTSQRFLACQTALHGARFAICDPHAGASEESLAATLAPLQMSMVCGPASTDTAMLEVVRYVAEVGRRRIEGVDREITPLILWVDELTALLGRSSIATELGALLERVAQEYRKRAVFVCASGQIWTAARTTSELRDSFASVLCHRMKRAQARLLLPTAEAEQVERLPVGQAVLWRTSGKTAIVRIPQTTATDVHRVAGMLATSGQSAMPHSGYFEASAAPTPLPKSSQSVANRTVATSASQSAKPVPAEAMRAATLFLDGSDPAAIVLELRSIRSSQGKTYQLALHEVLDLIRQGIQAT